ncbi:hypothetical protein C8Q78DRAFT_1081711 [Trametes maxima]|nr:hypothetical protein C8Q78DRAFT_1081711 [Trametes maxima]
MPSLNGTYGAIFIGMCISIALYGFNFHQIYRYYRLYPKDSISLKSLVFVILIVEAVNSVMPIHLCYDQLVTHYFDPLSLTEDRWYSYLDVTTHNDEKLTGTYFVKVIEAPLGAITIIVCQGFYIRRVYLIGPQWQYRVLVALAVVLLITEIGFMVLMTTKAFQGHYIYDFKKLTWTVSVTFGLAVSIDTIVTGTLITVLLRSRTGFKKTDSLIQSLVVYTFNSGLVTSISSTLAFIFALVEPDGFAYVTLGAIVAPKLYGTSVLAVYVPRIYRLAQTLTTPTRSPSSLNARKFLADRAMDGFTTDSLHFNNGNLAPGDTSGVLGQRSTRPVTISLPPDVESGDTATDSVRSSGPETVNLGRKIREDRQAFSGTV